MLVPCSNLKLKMNKLYLFFTRILCIFGSVYQTFKLSEIHFSYETTTNVRFESQTETSLPAVTVCYYKIFQLNEQIWRQNSRNTTILWDRVSHSTIQDQFNDLAQSPRRLDRCRLYTKQLTQEKNYINCSDVASYVEYLEGLSYCFTIFPQLNGEPDDKYSVFETENPYLYYFALKRNNESHPKDTIRVHMHSRSQVFYDNYSKGKQNIEVKERDYILLKYSKIVVKHVFNANTCFEGQTREECISKCKVKNFIHKTSKYPSNFATNERNSSLMFDRIVSSGVDVSAEECRSLCDQRIDCYKEYFTTGITYGEYPERVNDTFQVIIEYPTQPLAVYEVNLKMHLEEYLCLLSSIFSLWFGVSVLLFTDYCPVLFDNFKQYFKPFGNRIDKIADKESVKKESDYYHY